MSLRHTEEEQALFDRALELVAQQEPMAQEHVDTLSMLEEKTRNNLTDDEKHMLDGALYEARMRYVNVASQFT